MKADIHPSYREIEVSCACGNKFKINSTSDQTELHIDVCNECHPFYTGKQKIIDTAGRIDRFKKKFGSATKKAPAADRSDSKK